MLYFCFDILKGIGHIKGSEHSCSKQISITWLTQCFHPFTSHNPSNKDMGIYSTHKAALWKTSFRPCEYFTPIGHLHICLTLWPKWKINYNPDFWQLPLSSAGTQKYLHFSISLLGLTHAQGTMEPIITVVLHALKPFQLLECYSSSHSCYPKMQIYPLEYGSIWFLNNFQAY